MSTGKSMPTFVQLTAMDPALQRRDNKHADAAAAALAALADDLEGRTSRAVVAALKKKKSVFLVNTGIRENDKQWVKKSRKIAHI